MKTFKMIIRGLAFGAGALGSLALYGELCRAIGFDEGFKLGELKGGADMLLKCTENKETYLEEESADNLVA